MTPEEFTQRMNAISTRWQEMHDIFSQDPNGKEISEKFFSKMATAIEEAEEKAGQEFLALMMQILSHDPQLLMKTLKSLPKLN